MTGNTVTLSSTNWTFRNYKFEDVVIKRPNSGKMTLINLNKEGKEALKTNDTWWLPRKAFLTKDKRLMISLAEQDAFTNNQLFCYIKSIFNFTNFYSKYYFIYKSRDFTILFYSLQDFHFSSN